MKKEIHSGNALYKVPDLNAAKKFYSDVFGVPTYFDEPTWVIFEIGNYQFWIVPAESTEEHPEVYGMLGKPDGIIYWKVADVHSIRQKFIDHGGSAYKINRDGPFSHTIAEDPWGNKIGLVSGLR